MKRLKFALLLTMVLLSGTIWAQSADQITDDDSQTEAKAAFNCKICDVENSPDERLTYESQASSQRKVAELLNLPGKGAAPSGKSGAKGTND